MRFSESLWQKTVPIYEQILLHPFNVELAEGSLSKERFLFYMEQDAYYLVFFSKALALIASRFNRSKAIETFLHFSLYALVAERELHASFLASSYNPDLAEPSPACLGYTHYLLATAANASLEEAVAAVLPCFWIYREVGLHIAKQCVEDNPYKKWIETYSSQEFSEGVDRAIALLNELASQCPTQSLEKMKKAYTCSALYEWDFWNDAYKMNLFFAQRTFGASLICTI